ncbi:DUF2834 domain-containing protein [Fontimonas sp. SYSU GA230001]|uniref:DUF2834 domain-containing protein n=1 Tax=Fontimonas sp. SYSU GA230001 TaxID=3142450 RepID=UPI0032B3679E
MNRTVVLVLLGLVTFDFAALSLYAMAEHGYWGLFAHQLGSSAGWQVLADLVIVCTLAMAWMFADARRNGRNPWAYIALTVLAGSFGPLLYLLVGELRRPTHRAVLA